MLGQLTCEAFEAQMATIDRYGHLDQFITNLICMPYDPDWFILIVLIMLLIIENIILKICLRFVLMIDLN